MFGEQTFAQLRTSLRRINNFTKLTINEFQQLHHLSVLSRDEGHQTIVRCRAVVPPGVIPSSVRKASQCLQGIMHLGTFFIYFFFLVLHCPLREILSPSLGKAQQLREQRYPFPSVRTDRVFVYTNIRMAASVWEF